ncbi:hypothetical protein AVEN_253263-1, partial [Araneus ventricosus]
MSSLKTVKKTGILKTSTSSSQVKSSKVSAVSISEIPENEKMMLSKCGLFDEELLSNEVKSFKETRKSSLASKARKKLEAHGVASDSSWQNGSNTTENKEAEKKIDHKIMKRASNKDAITDEKNKENFKFGSEPMQYVKSKTVMMSAVEQGKRHTKQVNLKTPATDEVPVDSRRESAHKLKPKFRKLYSDNRQMKNNEEAMNSKGLKQGNTEPKRKANEQMEPVIPTRTSARIAEIEKISEKKEIGTPTRRCAKMAEIEMISEQKEPGT